MDGRPEAALAVWTKAAELSTFHNAVVSESA